MTDTYITKPGDTFSSVSRASTGSERNAQLIRQANPHAVTPIVPGTVLKIPGGDSKKGFKPFGLDIKIDGVSIQAYESFTHSMALDGFGRISFVVPNEKKTRELIPMLQPVAVDVGYNGVPKFSGYIETPVPSSDDKGKRIEVTASSWANMIASKMPITSFPIEFKECAMDVIAKTLIDPFMIEHFFYAEPGPVFKKITMEQSDSVLDLLSELCRQRAYVIRDDEFGSIVFDDGSISGAPIMRIDADTRPDIDVSISASVDDWYSHITGVLKSKRKRDRKKVVWENPFYRGILKNHEFEVSHIDEGELTTAVNSVAARMFGSVFELTVTIPGWTDKNGNAIKPGSSIEMKSETNYIPEMKEFLIAGVTNNGTPSSMTTTMTCVCPGSYAGVIPSEVPWK
jgi:LysM repeat protein